MAHVNTKLAIEIAHRIKEMLNMEIRKTGEIQINNKTIWDGWLHKLNNEEWYGVLHMMAELYHQHPELFKTEHVDAVEQGLQHMHKFQDYYDRCMDMNNRHVRAKRIAWKCIMAIREIFTLAQGEYLPNSDSSRVTSTYDELFD